MKKLAAVLLLPTLLCTMLCACQTGGTEPLITDATPAVGSTVESTVESTVTSTVTSTVASETTVSTPSSETEPTDPEQNDPPTPVDIETTGGVVIVGRIGFDENGWHIVPEQPLNIAYSYFLDQPSVFPGQTRISMIDPKDDGVDKTAYLGQLVTVYGEFRFVRNDFETLYLAPYTILKGRLAEESYGDPSLKAPEGPVDLYDPSIPLPKYLEPMTIDGGYIFNAFMLSEETLQLMGNDFASFYCDFVDAFLCYRSEVPCPEKRFAEMLSTVIYYDFPLFRACAEPFEFLKHYDPETNTINIEYLYGEAEHNQILSQFLKAADEMLATVTTDMSDVEKAKNIYHELCTRMVYDDSALEDFDRKDSSFAYLHNSGVCITFSNVYNQLLTQVGIKTTLATCDYTATMGHVWSVITLDGKDYFCDPTFELSYDNGSGYRYFGMNYADRTKDGLGKDGIRAGRYYTVAISPEMIAELSLQK